MEERKLATVQRCLEVLPIEGADRIELVKVLGWQCVIKKGDFRPGDLGIYIEVDSVVPDTKVFDFMRERKFRVKTIKLRGQISQGLFMSFNSLGISGPHVEGTDLTDFLKITKYINPEDREVSFMAPKKKGLFWKLAYRIPFIRKFILNKVGSSYAFPTHLVPKTDEERLQNLGDTFLETHKDVMVHVTTKMDGQSGTFIWYKKKFSVASRNVWFPSHRKNNYWYIADKVRMKDIMKEVFGKRNIAIQGEICGPGIQGNKYKMKEACLFVFNIYDIDEQRYFTFEEFCKFFANDCVYASEIGVVPSFAVGPIGSFGLTVKDWTTMATQKSEWNEDTYDEGLVARSLDNKPFGVRGLNGKTFSFKVISPEFQLQHKL